MSTVKYSEKLKDPRWQKKRLDVFERDKWGCTSCHNTERTLHVHHIKYNPGGDPWDVPMDQLLTLCSECHQYEEERFAEYARELIDLFRHHLFVSDDLLLLIDMGGTLLDKHGKKECLNAVFYLATNQKKEIA